MAELIEQQEKPIYISTKSLIKRYDGERSQRTIQRMMKWEVNPFPNPYFGCRGSSNLWLLADVEAWDKAEHLIDRQAFQKPPAMAVNLSNHAA